VTDCIEASIQILLDIEAFNHGFGDPVTVGQLVEIITSVTEMNIASPRCASALALPSVGKSSSQTSMPALATWPAMPAPMPMVPAPITATLFILIFNL
jgi:hypothetical protein